MPADGRVPALVSDTAFTIKRLTFAIVTDVAVWLITVRGFDRLDDKDLT